MMHLTKITDHLKFILIILVSLSIIEIWPLLGARNETELIGTLPDEFLTMQYILQMRDSWLYGNFSEIISFGTPFGYGYFYWVFMGLISLPFKELQYEVQILLFRLIGIAFKSIAFFYLFKTISYKSSNLYGIMAVVFLLNMPGFWFYGKVLSPEFVIIGLIAISVYLLIKDENKYGSYYYWSVVIFALAINIKMSLIPLAIMYPLYLFLRRDKQTLKHYLITPLVFVIVFFLFNITLITEIGKTSFFDWLEFNRNNTHTPNFESLKGFYLFDISTWERIPNSGMKVDYINVYLLLGFLLCFIWQIIKGKRNALLIQLFISTIIYTFIIMSTQIYQSWYLLAPMLMLAFSLFMINNPHRWTTYGLSALLIIMFFVNIERTVYKYTTRLDINQSIQQNFEASLAAQDYLTKHYNGGMILANPFLALPVTSIPNVIIQRDARILSNLENFSPDIFRIFPDTMWLYVSKDFNDDLVKDLVVDGRHYKFTLDKEFTFAKLFKRIDM
jgi:hypothetical protein